jgi:phosphoglycerate dehydrogenase-like enzyme
LDELIQNADVISLHIPLNSQTYHLINEKRIAAMKEGAIIINTARGGLIDENAAAGAIRDGHLRGIGLDVFEQEPLLESPLKGLPGVVFTPHTGAHTAEAVINMGLMAVNNLIDILEGRPNNHILNRR